MKESANIGERIKSLREAEASTQEKFADLVGVSQATVSAWELEDVRPSSESWLQLGNLARYPENLWFWQQAGIDPEKMLSAAGQILKEREAPPVADKILYFPCSIRTVQGGEEVRFSVPMLARHVPNPLSTRCLVVDEKLPNSIFPVGDALIVEEPLGDPQVARPFRNHIVLADLMPEHPGNPGMVRFWEKGLNIGRLRFKHETLRWYATLGPFIGTGRKGLEIHEETPIGYWDHPLKGEASQLNRADLKKLEDEARERALTEMRFAPGCRVIGRVIAWLRLPEPKSVEKE
jgi:transcriptional regulator with XRE-family HTH domain